MSELRHIRRAVRQQPRGSITSAQMAEGIFQQAFKGGPHSVKILENATNMIKKAQLENALYRTALQYTLALLGGGVVVDMETLQRAVLNRALVLESNSATHELLMRVAVGTAAGPDEDQSGQAELATALYRERRKQVGTE